MVSSTTSVTTTSSLATALGGGRGVDMTALANNLATAQFSSRNDRLAARSDKLDAQISAASNIKSLMLGLDTSLGSLVRSGSLARTPTIGNGGVATATLSGSSQPTGSYSLEVTKLAGGQQLASAPFAATTSPVGSGTLTLKFGTISGSSFAQDTGHAAVDIAIPQGATLADVATAINGAGARALKRSLSSLGSTTIMPGAKGTAKTLADLGLKTQRDGTFALDTDRLSATMASDPQGFTAMFTNGVNGVYGTVDRIYRAAVSSSDAYSLGSSLAGYTKSKTSISSEKSTLAEQQEKLRARLVSQFTASETRIGASKSTLSMLTNQIAQWNKSG